MKQQITLKTINRYTKIILTTIAVALIINIIKPIVTPVAAQANIGGGKFAHLHVYGEIEFFDTTTGNVWHYNQRSGEFQYCTKLIELGRDMVPCSRGRFTGKEDSFSSLFLS